MTADLFCSVHRKQQLLQFIKFASHYKKIQKLIHNDFKSCKN